VRDDVRIHQRRPPDRKRAAGHPPIQHRAVGRDRGPRPYRGRRPGGRRHPPDHGRRADVRLDGRRGVPGVEHGGRRTDQTAAGPGTGPAARRRLRSRWAHPTRAGEVVSGRAPAPLADRRVVEGGWPSVLERSRALCRPLGPGDRDGRRCLLPHRRRRRPTESPSSAASPPSRTPSTGSGPRRGSPPDRLPTSPIRIRRTRPCRIRRFGPGSWPASTPNGASHGASPSRSIEPLGSRSGRPAAGHSDGGTCS